MRVVTLYSAGYASNSYLIVDEESKEFAVVDPSVDPAVASDFFNDGYTLKYVLLTHGHFDHILFVDEWRANGAKVCIHEGDAEFLGDPSKSLYLQFFARDTKHGDADIVLRDKSIIKLGNNSIEVMSTPGHTKGSVCYIFDDVMISGDTLFEGSIGRTDLYGSSNTDMRETIEKLSAIDKDYTVYPGHGGKTTLAHEKTYGGYLHN
ncbi:MAG: MBL fold metallo-hydrolase [Clostridia bacterium]|nr:MBL fold metallo-hydrolase [Clostridia bacterium]